MLQMLNVNAANAVGSVSPATDITTRRLSSAFAVLSVDWFEVANPRQGSLAPCFRFIWGPVRIRPVLPVSLLAFTAWVGVSVGPRPNPARVRPGRNLSNHLSCLTATAVSLVVGVPECRLHPANELAEPTLFGHALLGDLYSYLLSGGPRSPV